MKYIYAYIAEAKMVYADPTAYFLGMLGANGFPLQGAVIFPLIFLFLTAFILSHGTAGIEKMSKGSDALTVCTADWSDDSLLHTARR